MKFGHSVPTQMSGRISAAIILGLFAIAISTPAFKSLFAQDEFITDEVAPANPQGQNPNQPPPSPLGNNLGNNPDSGLTPIPPPQRAQPDNLFEGEPLEEIDEPPVIPQGGAMDRANEPSRGADVERSPLTFPEPKKGPTRPAAEHPRSLPSLPGGAGGIPKKNEKLRMDFVQVDIEDVVKYFAERLHQKFIYDPSVLSGKITIISPNEVTLEEAYGAFLSAMEVRGYVIYPAGPYFKIEKAANARKVPTPIYQGSTPNDDSFVTRIYTLKWLSVNDIRQAVRNLLSRTGGDVIEHAPTNTLIISDYAYNIRRIVRILDILDIEGFQEKLEMIQLKNASAVDVARQINEFYPPQGGAQGQRRVGTTGGDGQQAIVQKVVADERTNSLFVLGSERGIEQIRDFVSRVDKPVAGGGGLIHVYPIQNVKAEDIAQTLSALASGVSSKRKGAGSNPSGIPGAPPLPGMNNAGGGDSSASLLNGDVKITADAPTNALVIQASSRDFDVIKGIIRKLDIRRRQVFIESAILEASVGRTSDFSLKASGPFAQSNILRRGDDKSSFIGAVGGVDLGSILANPAALTGLALGFRAGNVDVNTVDEKGAKTTVSLPILSALLKLSATNSDVNVISTPHILATANEEAQISIGEVYAERRGVTTASSGQTSDNFVDVNVSTELTLTPQINQDDYLTLKIKQKIDERGQTNSVTGQTTQIKRSASSTVIVKDQQTIVMGGLMKDKKTVAINKVPFLGDIPILGWLFKSRSTSSDKVNLLLFLTPYIIKDTADMNNTFFRKLKEREGFLKELGVEEKKGVPTSGLTPEQVKMLDPAYVKSLRLDPIPTKKEVESTASPAAAEKVEEKVNGVTTDVKPSDNAEPKIYEQPKGPSAFDSPEDFMRGGPNKPSDIQTEPMVAPAPAIPSYQAPAVAPIETHPLPSIPQPSSGSVSQPVAPAPAPAAPQSAPIPAAPGLQLEDSPPEDLAPGTKLAPISGKKG